MARAVAVHWGTPPSTGAVIDGVPLRALTPEVYLLRRPTLHIHDERLDERLTNELRSSQVALVFPSVHRSEGERPALTVHPLGNPAGTAEVGGLPRTLSMTAPRLMTDALRRIAEVGKEHNVPVSFEATHHGPQLGLPAFFVEIGVTPDTPPPEIVRRFSEILPQLSEDSHDRIAIAVGGGHYAPHFTDLALRRRWAFGHILSHHAMVELDAGTADAARELTPGAEGVLVARAQDYELPSVRRLGRRLKDGEATGRRPPEPD